MASWDDIMHVQDNDAAAAAQLKTAKVARLVAEPSMASWDDIMHVQDIDAAAAAQLKTAKTAAEIH